MVRLKNHAGLAIVVCGAGLLLSLLPLGTALQFSRDEGYEVMKAFICTKGYRLYQEIWNDQPPVHTMVLASAFRMFGPSILTARLVAAGFGVLLLATFHEVVRQRCSRWCALVSSFLLACSPYVLQLCASVMLEVPAFTMTLICVWLVMRWRSRGHWGWLVASGAAMGVALQTKFTAAVVLPAVLAEILMAAWSKAGVAGERQRGVPSKAGRMRIGCLGGFELRRAAINGSFWSAGLVMVLCIIGMTWAQGSLMSSWKSHFRESAAADFGGPADYPFNTSLLAMHLECVIAAVIALVWAAASKRWREITFPAVLLVTAALIHTVHRPWWNYYYLHLAIPMAWLAGWALCEAAKTACAAFAGPRFGLGSAKGVWAIVLCGLAAVVLSRSEARLEANFSDLRKSPTINADRLLATIRQNAARTHWMYAEPVIYAFHARLLVPPELVVVVTKRFWSGQINSEAIVATCERYRPEQILLPNGSRGGTWQRFLDGGYSISSADGNSTLYVSKKLTAAP